MTAIVFDAVPTVAIIFDAVPTVAIVFDAVLTVRILTSNHPNLRPDLNQYSIRVLWRLSMGMVAAPHFGNLPALAHHPPARCLAICPTHILYETPHFTFACGSYVGAVPRCTDHTRRSCRTSIFNICCNNADSGARVGKNGSL